jgi:phage/conjugal plasmid C-4 type zinc finger TraR family protein
MTTTKDDHDYSGDNMEEAEFGQLHAIHLNMNAVADVQRRLQEQALQPSLTECEDCGEDIPEPRRQAIKGCTRCVWCQELAEKK